MHILITGANSGIGHATAAALIKQGHSLTLACRSEDKAAPVLKALRAWSSEARAEFLPLDLSDLESVQHAARQFMASRQPLDVLVNNAGVAGLSALSKQGFELAFATNHLGHFLFTLALLPRLREAGRARVVNVSSIGHYRPRRIDWEALKRPATSATGLAEYNVSKLCNVLFTVEAARRWQGSGVHSYALHPGVIASDVWRHVPLGLGRLMKLFMASNEEGASTSVLCATSPALAEHDGRYYDKDGREKPPARLARDPALGRELWERSEAWVATYRCDGREKVDTHGQRP